MFITTPLQQYVYNHSPTADPSVDTRAISQFNTNGNGAREITVLQTDSVLPTVIIIFSH